MHPSLERELARIGRAWGALNDRWLATARDYSHGSPAFKWTGTNPTGAPIKALRFGSNTAVASPNADRSKWTHESPAPLSPQTPPHTEGE